jgi:hypothetical protein
MADYPPIYRLFSNYFHAKSIAERGTRYYRTGITNKADS